jgi:membrane protease YdiL (CAAX protease family)
MEFLSMVLLFVASSFVFSFEARRQRELTTIVDELGLALLEIGTCLLVIHLVRRDRGSLVGLGLRKTDVIDELLWGIGIALALIIGAIWAWPRIVDVVGIATVLSETHEVRRETLSHWAMPFLCLLGSVSEELLFRGYFNLRLMDLTSRPLVSALTASALFALMHGHGVAGSLYSFAFGLALAALFHRRRSLPRLMLAHYLFNLFNIYVAGGH